MNIKRRMRGLKFVWSPQKVKLLKKLWCVDGFHRIIVLNNIGCTNAELTYALRKFKLTRKRKATNKSKGTSFSYGPKLNLAKAREIRELAKQKISNKEIARRYNVTAHSISLIKHNKVWKEKEDA